MVTRRIILIAAALAVGGCGLSKQTAPSLSGESSFGLSLTLTASPALIVQDGSATSLIQVVALDANSQPLANTAIRVDTYVSGSKLDYGTLSSHALTTSSTGRATVVYTSPAAPPANATTDSAVSVGFTPVGTNFTNARMQTVDIALVRPHATTGPNTDLIADFRISPAAPKTGDPVVFDASLSADGKSGSTVGTGRTIASYHWAFSDGGTVDGMTVTHVFGVAGAAAATLTLTDDIGRTKSATQVLTLTPNPPTADFILTPTSPAVAQLVTFNGEVSKPGTGRTIVGYSWDFGDGTTASGHTVTHTFSQQQTYAVLLTVTDDVGQTATTSKSVTIGSAIAVASFTFSQPSAGAAVAFDGSGSTASAGATITTYDWDFGDSTTHGSGATPTHTYASPGTYTVVLTITDSSGKTAGKSISVQAN